MKKFILIFLSITLLLSLTQFACHLFEIFTTNGRIEIIIGLGGNDLVLQEVKQLHIDDALSYGFISLVVGCVMWAMRQKTKADSKE
jgi:hypothetical protein